MKIKIIHTVGITLLGLLLSNCAMSSDPYPPPSLPDSAWLAEDIGQAGVIDMLQSTLKFDVNMNVSGNGGCNRYFGSAKVNGDEIIFSQLGSTKMACSQAVMNQEQLFLTALTAMRSWRIDAERNLLYMNNEEGETILRFSLLSESN
jgi:heat shock protein HslJ